MSGHEFSLCQLKSSDYHKDMGVEKCTERKEWHLRTMNLLFNFLPILLIRANKSKRWTYWMFLGLGSHQSLFMIMKFQSQQSLHFTNRQLICCLASDQNEWFLKRWCRIRLLQFKRSSTKLSIVQVKCYFILWLSPIKSFPFFPFLCKVCRSCRKRILFDGSRMVNWRAWEFEVLKKGSFLKEFCQQSP